MLVDICIEARTAPDRGAPSRQRVRKEHLTGPEAEMIFGGTVQESALHISDSTAWRADRRWKRPSRSAFFRPSLRTGVLPRAEDRGLSPSAVDAT